ncbi:MAG: hypothetical protein KAT43_05100 [Nanoarchaeota archaeon]|nr:hypothetical protein [Nanoarchaeota archaeon]
MGQDYESPKIFYIAQQGKEIRSSGIDEKILNSKRPKSSEWSDGWDDWSDGGWNDQWANWDDGV